MTDESAESKRRHSRNPEGRDHAAIILAAATELIAEHGEKGLKITDVIERTGTSTGTIYHFYGSRARLVEAVQAQSFSAAEEDSEAGRALAKLKVQLEQASTTGEMMIPISQFISRFSGGESREDLIRIFDRVSIAQTKPGLRDVLADTQRRQTETYAEFFQLLQDKGLIDPELDPWATAVFIQAFMIGRLLGLIDGTDKLTPEAWTAVVMRFVSSIVVHD